MKEIERFMQYVHNWGVRTFGIREQKVYALKLKEEVQELIDAIDGGDNPDYYKDIDEEIADCFILLLHLASYRSGTFQDMLGDARDKMLINEARKWNFKGDGIAQHTEEDIKRLPFGD